ncbi:MAG: hypothetical protein AVDCRST_MAG86-1127, partial [uncultured Truepera sp.]
DLQYRGALESAARVAPRRGVRSRRLSSYLVEQQTKHASRLVFRRLAFQRIQSVQGL